MNRDNDVIIFQSWRFMKDFQEVEKIPLGRKFSLYEAILFFYYLQMHFLNQSGCLTTLKGVRNQEIKANMLVE